MRIWQEKGMGRRGRKRKGGGWNEEENRRGEKERCVRGAQELGRSRTVQSVRHDKHRPAIMWSHTVIQTPP